MEVQKSEEYNRLKNLYNDLDKSTSLLQALATVMQVTSPYNYMAVMQASNVVHAQGKGKSIIPDYKLNKDWEAEEELESYSREVDEIFLESITDILNRYLEYIRGIPRGSDSRIKALILLLFIKGLPSILLNLNLTESELDLVNSISELIEKNKMELVSELAQEFLDSNLPLHAKVVENVGVKILKLEPAVAIRNNFTKSEVMKEPINMKYLTKTMKDFSSRYVTLSTRLTGTLQDIIELPASTWKLHRNYIIEDLKNLSTEEELDTVTKLTLNF